MLLSACIFDLRYRKVAAIIKRVACERLSYHGMNELRDLAKLAMKNEKRKIGGAIVEAGCGLGGSAITLAAAKNKDRLLVVYDVFGLHPPPSEKDDFDSHQRYELIRSGKSPGIGDNLYYGYEKNLYAKVLQLFADFGFEVTENNVSLVRGYYEDTLKINSPVALAHIDCDWYDSVLVCLNRIEPHLVKGGVLVVGTYWRGSRDAVRDYFEKKNKRHYRFVYRRHLFIFKKSG